MDRILDERNASSIQLVVNHLSASGAVIATSVEKAFVDLQFNDLSTSAHAGDFLFSLAALSPQQRSLGASETLSHARSKGTCL